MVKHFVVAIGVLAVAFASPSLAAEQDAIDGCIDKIREVGGPDGRGGGELLSSDYSEAGTLVMLQDAGGTVWRCLAANDGTVEDLSVSEAMDDGEGAMAGAGDEFDDGGGAMAGSGEEGMSSTERVKFPAGASGVNFDAHLTPGSSVRYLLNAADGQFLNVEVLPQGPGISYQIFNPDGSFLLDMVSARTPYRGQLWQTGDHAVEVINRGHRDVTFTIDFWID
jgi:hypothetical protein